MAQASTNKGGTFTADGVSAEVTGTKFDILLNVTGTASLDVEVKDYDGTFFKAPSSSAITFPITADAWITIDFATEQTVRLNNVGAGPTVYKISAI